MPYWPRHLPPAPTAPSIASVCWVARRVRFKSRGRGLSSIENKRNDTGLRFVLETPAEGKRGSLIWKDDQLMALIDGKDPVVKYGLEHRIKYARLLQRKVSSPQAQGADACGFRTR